MRTQYLNGKNALDTARKEVVILKNLHHKNVVKLHEVIDDPSKDKLYIVMEYVEHGQVWNFGDAAFSVEKCRKYFRDIVEGLNYRIFETTHS